MKKNPEIIFLFILGALGILSKQFLSQTKYYPNFLKDFNNPFIEGLIIAVVFIILFGVPGFFIILLVEKIRRDSKKNLRSFKTLNEYYLNGNVPRVVKQTFITLPFYFYIKFKADEPFTFLFFKSAIEKADISYLTLLIPFLLCSYLIKLEFQNTKFDYIGEKYVDKNAGVQRLGLIYGIWYGLFGWLCSAILDFLLMAIMVIRLLI